MGDNLIATQESNIIFCENMMKEFMRNNILSGINIEQSIWVFNRLQNFEYNSMRINLINVLSVGAIETFFVIFSTFTPDDMTESFHWFTPDRTNWINSKCKEWLGI